MNAVRPHYASLYCFKLGLPRTLEDLRGLQRRLQLKCGADPDPWQGSPRAIRGDS